MTLEEQLHHARELTAWLDKSVNGLDAPATDRIRVAAGCLDQVHENHQGIRLLIECGLAGTACSLVRVTFESYVRGVWLKSCADEDGIVAFINDDGLPSVRELLVEIETLKRFSGGLLSELKKNYWASMCSYAHTGYLQALRRNTAHSIKPNYPEEEQVEVMRFASVIAVLAADELFELAGRDDLMNLCLQWLIELESK